MRVLDDRGSRDWRAVSATGLTDELQRDRLLVPTHEPADGSVPSAAGEARTILEHERLPFVSYPYEWTWSGLRDAAALQLEVLARALRHGCVLKDATPFNVQFEGIRPVFIDAGSFEPLGEGEPWMGYRQFCEQFLNPLLLRAYTGVDFRPWLRGGSGGIPPADLRALLGRRHRLRPAVLKHVTLHARQSASDREAREVRDELRRAGFDRRLIEANVRGLRRTIDRLRWSPPASAWDRYRDVNTYGPADAEAKERFVRATLERRRWPLVYDLGSHDATFARIAAASADLVVAMEGDPIQAERAHRALARDGVTGVLPLAVDLTDPSPALGWRQRERAGLLERARPDLVLCLALVHHLVVRASIPVAEVVAWLADFGATILVEVPSEDDPMVRRLMAAKRPEDLQPYGLPAFEAELGARFEIEERLELPAAPRVLYRGTPR